MRIWSRSQWGNRLVGIKFTSTRYALCLLLFISADHGESPRAGVVVVVPISETLDLGSLGVMHAECMSLIAWDYVEMKKNGTICLKGSAVVSCREGAVNFNTRILFAQFAGTFGVELTNRTIPRRISDDREFSVAIASGSRDVTSGEKLVQRLHIVYQITGTLILR